MSHALCLHASYHSPINQTKTHIYFPVPQEEVFKRREEALKLKDLELQESLIRFSKFLQVSLPKCFGVCIHLFRQVKVCFYFSISNRAAWVFPVPTAMHTPRCVCVPLLMTQCLAC